MPSFLVETFLARRDAAGRAEHEDRARLAAAELTRADVARTAERARLEPLRVVEVVSSGKEPR